MIRTVLMRYEATGREIEIETAMDDAFLERMYPGWVVISRK
jgi:hypothetical protein